MATPSCTECREEQRGIVEFRQENGCVTFQCSHCGASVEVRDVPVVALPPTSPWERESRIGGNT